MQVQKPMHVTSKNGYSIVRSLKDYRYYVVKAGTATMLAWAIDYAQALQLLNEVAYGA